MSANQPCPHCGKPVSPDALMGLCPDCMLQAGLGTGTPGPATAFVPPTPAELAGKFPQLEILELLGRGGMGAVYKARQKQLDRLVALKILPPGVGADPSFADRFAREAKALAKLNHPHIVTLYEFGQADGLFYFLMEYVDGVNLRQLLRSGRIAPKEALAIVPQICDALQYAHDRGIVHRDIKPENVLLGKDGVVKIADFGVAKIVAGSSTGVPPVSPGPGAADTGETPVLLGTAAGQVLGTPPYMAPEQKDHPNEVDHRADIYSLGVVFYQMLTGELPAGKFEPPSKKVVIDVRLDEVVLRALEQEPERRYQQASELKTGVETIVTTSSEGRAPSRPAARPEGADGAAPSVPSTPPRFSRTAIVGACWCGWGVMAALWLAILSGERVRQWMEMSTPEKLGFILTEFGLIVGFLSIFGTTILGWVAISQIRRSAGKLYGLGLALFDALLFPLLAVDGLFFLIRYVLVKPYVMGIPLSSVISIVSVVVDGLIIRWAWRAVKKPVGGSPMPVAAAPEGREPIQMDGTVTSRTGLATAALTLAIAGLLVALPLGGLVLYAQSQLPHLNENGQPMAAWLHAVLSEAFIIVTSVLLFLFEIPSLILGLVAWKERVGKAAAIVASIAMVSMLLFGFGWAVTARLRRDFGGIPTLERVPTVQVLAQFDWAKLAAEHRLLGGVPVNVDGRSALKIENPPKNPSELQLPLFRIEYPSITAIRYALTGKIKYENVQSDGYLEMWSYFPPLGPGQPEQQYFSRTLGSANSGAFSRITGTSGWRTFSLFFDRTGTTNPPTRLEVNLYLPGRGVVFVGPLKLVQVVDTGRPTPVSPNATAISFGPVIERVVHDPDTGTSRDCSIDLDTGELHSVLEMTHRPQLREWAAGNKLDAMGKVVITDGKPVSWGLEGIGLRAVALKHDEWETITASDARDRLRRSRTTHETQSANMMAFEQFPDGTYLFETREGGLGVLQIVGLTDNPRGVKIRYKLVQTTREGAGWGESVGGLQARLRPTQPKWPVGSIPQFKADVRNQSKQEFSIAQAQDLCRLELDGQEYQWVGDFDVKSSWFPPGREYDDIAITLGKEWQTKDGQPLKSLPDKHTLRVAFYAQPKGDGGKLGPIRFFSNAVEFEVVKAEEIRSEKFGPVIERVVNGNDRQAAFLNLDSGEFVPRDQGTALNTEELRRAGVQLYLSPLQSDLRQLTALDVWFLTLPDAAWTNTSAVALQEMVRNDEAARKVWPLQSQAFVSPGTYAFRTKHHLGLFQLLPPASPGWNGVKIRYQLVAETQR